jgi:hypothetical protein
MGQCQYFSKLHKMRDVHKTNATVGGKTTAVHITIIAITTQMGRYEQRGTRTMNVRETAKSPSWGGDRRDEQSALAAEAGEVLRFARLGTDFAKLGRSSIGVGWPFV